MSHPPKSTNLAPSARWTQFKGVDRRADAAGMKTQANNTGRGCQFSQATAGDCQLSQANNTGRGCQFSQATAGDCQPAREKRDIARLTRRTPGPECLAGAGRT